jgi:predicted secreted protein
MKATSPRILKILALVLMVLLSSCTAPGSIDIDCDAFANSPNQVHRIEVREGAEITISLCSNPTTGYNWKEDAELSNPEVIVQDHQEFTAQGSVDDPPPPGSPGIHTWTFSTLKAGESIITLGYSQPWDGGEKNSWTFTLTVVVR